MSWSGGTPIPSSRPFVTTPSRDAGSATGGTALEQYKLAVEMADRTSGRRQTANAFFLSVVSALTVTNGTKIVSEWYWTCLVAVVAVLVCFMWWRLLASYRAINHAKYQVIHKMELMLPFQMFADEERIYSASRKTGYKPLSRIEQSVPAIFALINLAAIPFVV